MEKYTVHIGESLKKNIKKHNINISELSEATGFAREYIYQLYKKEDVKTDVIKKIVNNSQINIAELLQIKQKTIQKKQSEAKAPAEAPNEDINTIAAEKREIENLKRENELLQELIKTKDTLIKYLMKEAPK
ncbi:DUF6262 family protein [Capnocytophaga canis]|uniref:DUF6262 family protein n=1 Tax=Capnocytophaga canis TaxID=1848903 RepID=UPI0015626440|nr:DUF6262 family protein [Capnocytophaga canis]